MEYAKIPACALTYKCDKKTLLLEIDGSVFSELRWVFVYQ